MALPTHYAVGEGLIAGAYPGLRESVEGSRAGVTVFVDLTHPSDPLESYDRFLAAAADRPPDPGHGHADGGPRDADPRRHRRVRAEGGTVYVHCWGGIGRTGTVVGCWLVRHGLDEGDAIARIAALRSEIGGAPRPRPPARSR